MPLGVLASFQQGKDALLHAFPSLRDYCPDLGREKAALILSWLSVVFYTEVEMEPKGRAWRVNFLVQTKNQKCDSGHCMEPESCVVKPKS